MRMPCECHAKLGSLFPAPHQCLLEVESQSIHKTNATLPPARAIAGLNAPVSVSGIGKQSKTSWWCWWCWCEFSNVFKHVKTESKPSKTQNCLQIAVQVPGSDLYHRLFVLSTGLQRNRDHDVVDGHMQPGIGISRMLYRAIQCCHRSSFNIF